MLKLLFKQINKSFSIAKSEGVEELSVYREYYQKLALLSGTKKTFDEMRDKGTLFATIGNIRSKKRTLQALNVSKRFLASKWVTPEGRESIYKKSISTGMRNNAVSEGVYKESVKYIADAQKKNREARKQALQVADIIENEVVPDIVEEWLPPSELIFIINEIIEDNGLNHDYFYECIDYVKQNARSLNEMDDMRDAVYHYFDGVMQED